MPFEGVGNGCCATPLVGLIDRAFGGETARRASSLSDVGAALGDIDRPLIIELPIGDAEEGGCVVPTDDFRDGFCGPPGAEAGGGLFASGYLMCSAFIYRLAPVNGGLYKNVRTAVKDMDYTRVIVLGGCKRLATKNVYFGTH